MAIQIIDGFQVNVASPIDNRIVASGSTARNDIPYKYEGLRVFDISNGIPYVWYNGAWVSENASGVSGVGTTTNYVPLYTSSNIIGNSVIYQSGSSIGINTLSPSATFSVNGSLSANTLSGDGQLLTNLNASNLSTGTLALNRLANGSTGWILVGGLGTATYSNPTQITVGTASAASAITINNTTTNAAHYLTFISGGAWTSTTSNSVIRANTGISYNPSTNLLSIGSLTASGQLVTNANVICRGGLIDIGNTSGSRNAYLTSGGSGVTELGSYNNRPILFSTGNTSLVERMRIANAGISHINNSFTSHGSFVIGTGTLSETTQITITSQTYDRVIYMYGSNHSNTYYMTAGWVQITAYIGGQQIYSSFFGTDSDFRPSFSYSYILPAGVSSVINLQKNGVTYNTGSGTTVYVNSLKFGLS